MRVEGGYRRSDPLAHDAVGITLVYYRARGIGVDVSER
jgi:hypothetical protein